MPPERRRLIILVALLVVVAGAGAYQFWPSTQAATARAAVRAAARQAQGPTSVTAPDVHLPALRDDRPQPVEDPRRDLFRFKPKAPPPRPVEQRPAFVPRPVVSDAPTAPAGPPPLPPIAMRFIGLVEEQDRAQKIAILTDGRGIYQGREGDIIEGRYRIVRIGVESVEMAYLDGRGRQTIRLSGS